jgi:hypothetical protein
MRVVVQRLTPGVQHGDCTDFGTEVTWIGGDVAQRVSGGAEQDGVDDVLVLERDLGCQRRTLRRPSGMVPMKVPF